MNGEIESDSRLLKRRAPHPAVPELEEDEPESGRDDGASSAGESTGGRRKKAKPRSLAPDDEFDPEALVPQDVRDALAAFVPPAGYDRLEPPPRTANRSNLWLYGVRLQERVEEGRNATQLWTCLATENCRSTHKPIKVSLRSASSATDHLFAKHGIMSHKTQISKQSEIRKKKPPVPKPPKPAKVTATSMWKGLSCEELLRRRSLAYVKAYVIGACVPLSHCDDRKSKDDFLFCFGDLPLDRINGQQTRHLVVEVYNATRHAIQLQLEAAAADACTPIFHVSLEVWDQAGVADSGIGLGGDRYIGIRITYVNQKWQLQSHLLAVRRFDITGMNEMAVHASLRLWLRQVLAEFQVDPDRDVFGAVTDPSVLPQPSPLVGMSGETCLPSTLSRALALAFGLEVDGEPSRNSEGKALIMEITRMPGLIPAPNHWVMILNALEDNIRTGASAHGAAVGQLGISASCIRELYSILKPAVDIFEAAGGAGLGSEDAVPGASRTLQLMLALRLKAEISKPLVLLVPSGVGGPIAIRTAEKEHAALTKLAQNTRMLLGGALDELLIHPRYRQPPPQDPAQSSTGAFDMVMALYPATKNLSYIKRMSGGVVGAAESAQASVWSRLEQLTAGAVESSRIKGTSATTGVVVGPPAPLPDLQAQLMDTGGDAGGAPPADNAANGGGSAKGGAGQGAGVQGAGDAPAPLVLQPLPPPKEKRPNGEIKEMAELGILDTSLGARQEVEVPPPAVDAAMVARREIAMYRNSLPTADVLSEEIRVLKDWQAIEGLPYLKQVARSLLGIPPHSTAITPRDFTPAKTLPRVGNDAVLTDMILFMFSCPEALPLSVVTQLKGNWWTHVPERFMQGQGIGPGVFM